MHEALMSLGSRLLGELLSSVSTREIPPEERRKQEHRHQRKRTLHTVLGLVSFTRDYYWCPECTRIPFDQELGIDAQHYSPGIRKMMGYASSQGSYRQAALDLQVLAGLTVPVSDIQREVEQTAPLLKGYLEQGLESLSEEEHDTLYIATDGTGAPMRKEELVGRPGKQPDGSARTREIKVGCIFSQQETDAEGRAMRVPGSSSYLANFKQAQNFGSDLLAEARHRRLDKAGRVVFIGDGAHWVWEISRVNFPDAIEILDYFHAAEHLVALHQSLFGPDDKRSPLSRWKNWLSEGKIECILEAGKRHAHRASCQNELASALNYFAKNIERMRYGKFKQKGLFIGSGVVEAACRTVVAQRFKKSGMFWSVKGAEAMLLYRCAVMNERYDGFWKAQASRAA